MSPNKAKKVLQRRLLYLKQKITKQQGSNNSLNFDYNEAEAISLALDHIQEQTGVQKISRRELEIIDTTAEEVYVK